MSDPSRSRATKQWHGPTALTVTVHGNVSRGRIELAGELDLSTAPQLSAALEEVYALGSRCVVIDMSKLSFLSAVGLEMLCEAARHCRTLSGSLELARPTAHIRRLLQITDLDTELLVSPPSGRSGE